MSEWEARRLVEERAQGWCEVRLPEVCQGRATNWHHRQNRSQGGRWLASNGIALCGSGTTGCHGWITEHPSAARENGWAVGASDLPALVPVLLHTQCYRRAVVLLDDEGCYVLHGWPEQVDSDDPWALPTLSEVAKWRNP